VQRSLEVIPSLIREKGHGMTDDAEQRLKAAHRWFTEGWAGDIAMADDIFGDELRTNGVHVGPAGPKGRITERISAFPDITTEIVDMFAAGDKVVTHLLWRGTHTGNYGGVEPTHRPAEVRDIAIWRFENDKVVEISTLQDQFGLLKQVGLLPSAIRAA